MMAQELRSYYRTLLRHYGPQHWWPAESPFEVIVGAILTQNTSWSNVEKAIRTLKSNGLLDPHRLHEIDLLTLATAIRSAGYFNVKAMRLKEFVRWFLEKFEGKIERMRAIDPLRMREMLLEVKGIGNETADSILLYALHHPVFVVDTYTHRILHRHELLPEETTYEEMKELFESSLPHDRKLYNDFHAQIVNVGKEFCRTKARCEKCPLKQFLPRHR